jgi:hypothetical protein
MRIQMGLHASKLVDNSEAFAYDLQVEPLHKCIFQPTVAGSSTEAEFMATADAGKMILFVRSVLWDLGIP